MAFSGDRTPTCTCTPKICSRRASHCISLDQLQVALLGRDLLGLPVGERVGAGAHHAQAAACRRRATTSASVPARSALASSTVVQMPVMISIGRLQQLVLGLRVLLGAVGPHLLEDLDRRRRSARGSPGRRAAAPTPRPGWRAPRTGRDLHRGESRDDHARHPPGSGRHPAGSRVATGHTQPRAGPQPGALTLGTSPGTARRRIQETPVMSRLTIAAAPLLALPAPLVAAGTRRHRRPRPPPSPSRATDAHHLRPRRAAAPAAHLPAARCSSRRVRRWSSCRRSSADRPHPAAAPCRPAGGGSGRPHSGRCRSAGRPARQVAVPLGRRQVPAGDAHAARSQPGIHRVPPRPTPVVVDERRTRRSSPGSRCRCSRGRRRRTPAAARADEGALGVEQRDRPSRRWRRPSGRPAATRPGARPVVGRHRLPRLPRAGVDRRATSPSRRRRRAAARPGRRPSSRGCSSTPSGTGCRSASVLGVQDHDLRAAAAGHREPTGRPASSSHRRRDADRAPAVHDLPVAVSTTAMLPPGPSPARRPGVAVPSSSREPSGVQTQQHTSPSATSCAVTTACRRRGQRRSARPPPACARRAPWWPGRR